MRLILVLLAAILPLPLFGQSPRDSVVTISVTLTTRMAPDRAVLYVIVEGAAETAADAITRGAARLKAVTDALRTFGTAVRVESPIPYGVGPAPSLGGYPPPTTPPTSLARSVLRVQVDRLDQLASIIAAALGAGAATSSSLSFELSSADSVRRARMSEVLQVARLDADAVATALGARLGSLVSVTSAGGPFGFQPPVTLSFDSRFGQASPSPDMQVLTTVTVQYRLVR